MNYNKNVLLFSVIPTIVKTSAMVDKLCNNFSKKIFYFNCAHVNTFSSKSIVAIKTLMKSLFIVLSHCLKQGKNDHQGLFKMRKTNEKGPTSI